MTKDDVKDACEEIHKAARELKWSISKLARESGHSFSWQSFNNWKQGHGSPPKLGLLQKAAATVGSRIRVVLESLAPDTGLPVVKTPRKLGGDMARRPNDDEDLSGHLDRIGVTDPDIRRKAAKMALEAAAKIALQEYKRQAAEHPTEPTAKASPSRGRRKNVSGA